MENSENLVVETENVEQPTEEVVTPKTYTQEEVDAIVGKRIARKEAKIRKEYDRNYGDLVNVLKAGTGKESVEDITETFRGFYQKKGIPMATKPNYTDEDIAVLARADAEEIINAGYEEVVDEVDRLSKLGLNGMNAREKALFKTLAEHRQNTERGRELNKLGVTEDIYNGKEFKDFAGKFNANTPINEVYDLFRKTHNTREIKSMGSMKTNTPADSGVKEYYSPEEARKFTKKDFDSNPALYAAVEKSMLKWGKR